MPTVIMGCARDIVEQAGVPRFWWSDFPLGHSAGKPQDAESQKETLAGALALFDGATGPDTTVVSPQLWSDSEDWKQDFMDVAKLDPDIIEKLKREHEKTRSLKRATT